MNLEEKRHRNKSSDSGIFLFYSLSVAKRFVSSVPGFPNSLSSFIYSKRKNIIWVTRLGRDSRFDRWNIQFTLSVNGRHLDDITKKNPSLKIVVNM